MGRRDKYLSREISNAVNAVMAALPGVELPAEKVVVPGHQAIEPTSTKTDLTERPVQRFSDASHGKGHLAPENARISRIRPSWPVITKKADDAMPPACL